MTPLGVVNVGVEVVVVRAAGSRRGGAARRRSPAVLRLRTVATVRPRCAGLAA